MVVIVAVTAAGRTASADTLEMRPGHDAEHPHHVGRIAILGEIAIGGVDVDDHPLRLAPVAERLPGDVPGGLLIGHAGVEALARLNQDIFEIMLQFAYAVL